MLYTCIIVVLPPPLPPEGEVTYIGTRQRRRGRVARRGQVWRIWERGGSGETATPRGCIDYDVIHFASFKRALMKHRQCRFVGRRLLYVYK